MQDKIQGLITKTRSLPAVNLAGDESTKEEGGSIKNHVLFRGFQISCFRDWLYFLFFILSPVFCILYSTCELLPSIHCGFYNPC